MRAGSIVLAARAMASEAFGVAPSETRGSGAPVGALLVVPRFSRSTARPVIGGPQRRSALHSGVLSASGRAFREAYRPSVSRLPAGTRSGPGRSPEAARVRACEARARAPHRPVSRGFPSGPAIGFTTHISGPFLRFVPPSRTPHESAPSADEVTGL